MNEVVIKRREVEKWMPVWYHMKSYGGKTEKVRAIAGNPSRTGKTVRIRFRGIGGECERNVSPKNLEPRSQASGGTEP
jgi:hypothetical protein